MSWVQSAQGWHDGKDGLGSCLCGILWGECRAVDGVLSAVGKEGDILGGKGNRLCKGLEWVGKNMGFSGNWKLLSMTVAPSLSGG